MKVVGVGSTASRCGQHRKRNEQGQAVATTSESSASYQPPITTSVIPPGSGYILSYPKDMHPARHASSQQNETPFLTTVHTRQSAVFAGLGMMLPAGLDATDHCTSGTSPPHSNTTTQSRATNPSQVCSLTKNVWKEGGSCQHCLFA